jgi:hypothetical protein
MRPALKAGGPAVLETQNHFASVEGCTGIPCTSVRYRAASDRRSFGGQFTIVGTMLNQISIKGTRANCGRVPVMGRIFRQLKSFDFLPSHERRKVGNYCFANSCRISATAFWISASHCLNRR